MPQFTVQTKVSRGQLTYFAVTIIEPGGDPFLLPGPSGVPHEISQQPFQPVMAQRFTWLRAGPYGVGQGDDALGVCRGQVTARPWRKFRSRRRSSDDDGLVPGSAGNSCVYRPLLWSFEGLRHRTPLRSRRGRSPGSVLVGVVGMPCAPALFRRPHRLWAVDREPSRRLAGAGSRP